MSTPDKQPLLHDNVPSAPPPAYKRKFSVYWNKNVFSLGPSLLHTIDVLVRVAPTLYVAFLCFDVTFSVLIILFFYVTLLIGVLWYLANTQ